MIHLNVTSIITIKNSCFSHQFRIAKVGFVGITQIQNIYSDTYYLVKQKTKYISMLNL